MEIHDDTHAPKYIEKFTCYLANLQEKEVAKQLFPWLD